MGIRNQWEVADLRIQERIDAAIEEQFAAELDEIANMELLVKVEEGLLGNKTNSDIMNEQMDRNLAKIIACLDGQEGQGEEAEQEVFVMADSCGLSRAAQEILKGEVIFINHLSKQELEDAESKSMMQMLAMTCDYEDRECLGWTIENGMIKVRQINALKAEKAVWFRVESIRREDDLLFQNPLVVANSIGILLNHAAHDRAIKFNDDDDPTMKNVYRNWCEELKQDEALRKGILLHTEDLVRLQMRISDRINASFTGDLVDKPDAETLKNIAMIAGLYRADKEPERIFKQVNIADLKDEERLGSWKPENHSTRCEGETK